MTYKEMVKKMEIELAAEQDADEREYKQAIWNIKLVEQFKKERAEKYALTTEQIREKYLGKQIYIYSTRVEKRVLKEDADGLYISWFGDKAAVKWDAAFNSFKIDYIR